MIPRCDLVPQYKEIRQEILDAVDRVMASGRHILGEEVAHFESEFSRYLGCQYTIGVGNATDALTMALKAFGIEPGDEVITSPFTAVPTVNAIYAAGAVPIFSDVDPDTYLMDIDHVKSLLTVKTKAIMPVHIFGNVVDIERLRDAVGPDLPIVEDASQAHGSTIRGRKAGTIGTVGVFSFYPTKNLGGYGDGGAIVSDRKDISDHLRLIRAHGMLDKDTYGEKGINSRLDELQATILRVKLRDLDSKNARRNAIAKQYRDRLPTNLFVHQKISNDVVSNFHVYVARFKGNRSHFMAYLDQQGIQANIYYVKPLYAHAPVANSGRIYSQLPHVEKLCNEVVALPLYPEMPEEHLDAVINTISAYEGVQ